MLAHMRFHSGLSRNGMCMCKPFVVCNTKEASCTALLSSESSELCKKLWQY